MNARLVSLVAGLALLAGVAHARVYTLHPTQTFEYANPGGAFGPPKVAIARDSAIALLDTAGGREAVLFQRDAAGQWAVVDGVLVAEITDNIIPDGQFGIGMYRTAATFSRCEAEQ